jgi:ATP-dependent DNA helicase RecQ
MHGSGIIYTATTKGAQETAAWLREWGVTADYYHGQRRKADRERVQNAFMSGEVRVIAATNAFGLGVDKPDVRFVIHRDVPASVEAYYQEAGRAGRDGEFARCTLIYRPADLGRAAFLSGHGQLSPEDVEAVHRAAAGHSEVTLPELTESTGLSHVRLRRVIDLLAGHDILRTRGPRVRFLSADWSPEQVSLQDEENRKEYERSRLQMMRGYAELRDCRRRYLLNYFGEEQETPRCGCCDCDVLAEETQDGASGPFQIGAVMEHPTWGDGEITQVQGDILVIRFRSGEEHRLSAAIAQENGLLTVRSTPSVPQAGDPEGFQLGDPVTHAQYGAGVVQRVTPESVTVLFETSGYHTLDLERVVEEGLLESAPTVRGAA